MLAEALQAEVDAYIATPPSAMRMAAAWWSATAPPAAGILTSAGAIEVTVPRVNDKRTHPRTRERKRFSSAIVPPWARKTPKITEVLPLLYLHRLSSGDFVPALGQFLGSSAAPSAALITKLTETWPPQPHAGHLRRNVTPHAGYREFRPAAREQARYRRPDPACSERPQTFRTRRNIRRNQLETEHPHCRPAAGPGADCISAPRARKHWSVSSGRAIPPA
jgi:hypothetical protein